MQRTVIKTTVFGVECSVQFCSNFRLKTTLHSAAVSGLETRKLAFSKIIFQNFVNDVKLEPFKRALIEHNPDVWFTNIRRGQTAYRDTLDILSLTSDGILKVSPFYFWTDTELRGYLSQFNLPNEFIYFDPTKPKSNLECGIQFK